MSGLHPMFRPQQYIEALPSLYIFDDKNYITGAKDALRTVRKQRISKCKKTFAFIKKKFTNRMEIFINMCYNIIICHKIRRVSQYAHQLQ